MLTLANLYSILTKRNNGADVNSLVVSIVVDVATFGAGYLVGAA